MKAAIRSHTACVIALIKAKADINAKDDVRVRGGCPYTWAVSQYRRVFVVGMDAIDCGCS